MGARCRCRGIRRHSGGGRPGLPVASRRALPGNLDSVSGHAPDVTSSEDGVRKRDRRFRGSWWLPAAAAMLTLGYTISMVVFYRVPWGGTFDGDLAGPAAAWSANFITALGLLGLVYQLQQIRIDRRDETAKAINTLYMHRSVVPWSRNNVLPGSLVYVYVRNNGERKALSLSVELTLSDAEGSELLAPDEWFIKGDKAVDLPASMSEAISVAIVHVPSVDVPVIAPVVVRLTWRDPLLSRWITMVNNGSSVEVEEVRST